MCCRDDLMVTDGTGTVESKIDKYLDLEGLAQGKDRKDTVIEEIIILCSE